MASKKQKQSKSVAAEPYPAGEPRAADTTPSTLEPHVGQVFVKFNAGGHGSFVDPNPAQPTTTKNADGKYSLRWVLQRPENANPNYGVKISNVVLCDKKDEPAGFESQRVPDPPDASDWEWTFDEPFPPGAYRYDLFFVYESVLMNISHLVSLRQVIDFDPTVFTPPVG